jgi:hypothetical protein
VDSKDKPFCQAALMSMCTLLAGAVGGSLSLVVEVGTITTGSREVPSNQSCFHAAMRGW